MTSDVTATDRETLRVLGYAMATVADLAGTLGIGHTAAYQRLERLRMRGLVTRHGQPGRRAALYESNDTAGRAAALVAAVSPELPPAEARAFERAVLRSGHSCVACGLQHANCCGLCPQWVPLPGEGARNSTATGKTGLRRIDGHQTAR